MDIVDKIKKLLIRAQAGGSIEEAALAGARARELMTKFRIEEADVSLSQGTEREVEHVQQQILEDSGSKKAVLWRINLACNLASCFGSRCYFIQGTGKISIVGRPSDAQTVRYLHAMICLEIVRLTEEGWASLKASAKKDDILPRPSVWKDSFRAGAVAMVSARLRKQHAADGAALRATIFAPETLAEVPEIPKNFEEAHAPEERGAELPEPPTPLPPSSSAVALVVQDEARAAEELEMEWKRIMGPRGGGHGSFKGRRHSSDGYSAGAAAGGTIRLGGGKGLPRSAAGIGS